MRGRAAVGRAEPGRDGAVGAVRSVHPVPAHGRGRRSRSLPGAGAGPAARPVADAPVRALERAGLVHAAAAHDGALPPLGHGPELVGGRTSGRAARVDRPAAGRTRGAGRAAGRERPGRARAVAGAAGRSDHRPGLRQPAALPRRHPLRRGSRRAGRAADAGSRPGGRGAAPVRAAAGVAPGLAGHRPAAHASAGRPRDGALGERPLVLHRPTSPGSRRASRRSRCTTTP